MFAKLQMPSSLGHGERDAFLLLMQKRKAALRKVNDERREGTRLPVVSRLPTLTTECEFGLAPKLVNSIAIVSDHGAGDCPRDPARLVVLVDDQ